MAQGLDPKVARVREAMSKTLVYCFEEQDTSEAATLMAENKVRRLPVLDENDRLCGIVSLGDLARESRGEQAHEALEGVSQPGGSHEQ